MFLCRGRRGGTACAAQPSNFDKWLFVVVFGGGTPANATAKCGVGVGRLHRFRACEAFCVCLAGEAPVCVYLAEPLRRQAHSPFGALAPIGSATALRLTNG